MQGPPYSHPLEITTPDHAHDAIEGIMGLEIVLLLVQQFPGNWAGGLFRPHKIWGNKSHRPKLITVRHCWCRPRHIPCQITYP